MTFYTKGRCLAGAGQHEVGHIVSWSEKGFEGITLQAAVHSIQELLEPGKL